MNREATRHFPELTSRTFDEQVLRSSRPVVVDFWASWCAPCLMMGQTLHDIADRIPAGLEIVKVNVDENPELAERYGIRSIPTLLFVDRGEILGTLAGAVPGVQLLQIFERFAGGDLARA